MSIQQEEITIKEFTSGTTLLFFSTHLNAVPSDSNEEVTVFPAIIELNNLGLPVGASTFDGENIWSMNDSNIYVPTPTITTSFITGYSYVQDFNYIVSEERVETFKNRLSLDINNSLLGLDAFGNITGTTAPNHTEYVFSWYHEIDDFYVNLKINRTTATLDTFNVYNNLVNSMPTQDAETGVVFGRLMALQTLKDSEGNNIRIPLRNVSVGVFNPSVDYPTAASVTDNGDRLFLNIKEAAEPEEYFNIESFNFDKDKLLRSGSQFNSVPEQYKYITKTNDEGEFVLYDIPIGTQVVVFEVDLLKQGLTRDEIALNFFPFPPDEDAQIDQIPNFSFKQFPINVVPSWGTIQTGYTELDVVINMDLRKWTTYFFPPVSLNGEKLEASVAKNAANTLKINVRNMAKEDYPNTNIKVTEIQNDLDRVLDQQLNWQLEFAQIKNKSEFYKFGTPILKLPANLYDPNGFRTDADGIPGESKGVWLSAYQFHMYVDPTKKPSRRSGGIHAWNGSGTYFKSHYDLTYAVGVPDENNQPRADGSFPYEQPWTIDYPNQYSIPRKPTDERYRYSPARTPSSDPLIYYLDEPAYNDGDLIGFEIYDEGVSRGGGFGSQNAFGAWFQNRIAESVTKNFMYKYESQVGWTETYANGYQPSNPYYPRFAGVSSVVGGEKYQRFESGYGYFMKPLGWPRIVREVWGADTYFGTDIRASLGLTPNGETPAPGVSSPGTLGQIYAAESNINDVYNINNINIALALDKQRTKYQDGTLEAYRIVNSNPSNLAEQVNFIIPTKAVLDNGESAARGYQLEIKNKGVIPITMIASFNGNGADSNLNYIYKNLGTNNESVVQFGESVTLEPGETITGRAQIGTFQLNNNPIVTNITGHNPLGWTSFYLQGNSNYNTTTNRYDSAKYEIRIWYTEPIFYSKPRVLSFDKAAKTSPDIWYLKTGHEHSSNGAVSRGLNTGLIGGEGDKKIWSPSIQDNPTSYAV
jgi:hypothetical protein